jgi:Zn-dependent M28 family amino/carboxypeptidase
LSSRLLSLLAAAALSAGLASAQRLQINLAEVPAVNDRLIRGAVPQKLRQQTIHTLFTEEGCPAVDQQVDRTHGNVICTLPGETESTIIVGAHLDFADEGKGMVDDWSGTAMLPSLYHAIKIQQRKHTFVFVSFTREEEGLLGSKYYVRKLTPIQKSQTGAFINLECLGVTPTKVWVSRATPALMSRLLEIAHTIGDSVSGVNVDRVGDDDTHAFIDAKIPVITIHSITQETWPILHSARDTIDAIDLDQYYKSYRLLAFYLAYLDSKLDTTALPTK